MSRSFDQWNPQREAFKNQDFNSYDRGPGKYIGSKNYKNEDNVRLHVCRLPPRITEDGLRALFSKTGVVTHVWKHPENIFAFVTMASLRCAESAIRQLNDQTIESCRIRVTVAKNDKEKNDLLQQKKDEEEFFQKLRVGNSQCQDEDWNNDDYPTFSAVDLLPPNNTCANGAGGDSNFASAKKTSPKDNKINGHNSSGPKNKRTVFGHQNQLNQNDSASKKLVNEINGNNLTKQLMPCLRCSKPGTKRCSQCKSPYCSVECQQQDWLQNHHKECINIYLQNASLEELADRFDVDLNGETILDNKPPFSASKETLHNRNQEMFRSDETEKMPMERKFNPGQSSPRDLSSSQSSKSDMSPEKPSSGKNKKKTFNRSRRSPKVISGKELEFPSDSMEEIQKPSFNKQQKSPPNSVIQKKEQIQEKSNVAINSMKIPSKLQLPLNEMCQVMVTNVASSEEIHIQLIEEDNVRMTTHLVTQLAKIYTDNSRKFPCISSPRVGEIYACCFSADNFWYRAQILAVNGSDITVKYIDYGNTEITSCSKIKALVPELREIPEQVICCALGISPTNTREDLNLLVKQEIKCDQPYRLKVIRTGQPYIIELYNEHGDVGKKLSKQINSKLELERSVLNPTNAVSKKTPRITMVADMKNRSFSLKTGSKYSIFPFNIISPDDFMVLVVVHDEHFQQFNQKLQSCALSCPMLTELPVPNQLVLVQNLLGQWCRAEVIQINNSKLTVLFLDHGSIEVISSLNARACPSFCCVHPFMIVRSKLAEIKPVDKQGWSPKLCNIFKETLEAMNESVRVKSQHILGEYDGLNDNGKSLWKLIDVCTNTSIASLLVLDGHAVVINPTSSHEEKELQSCKIMVSDIPKIPLAVGNVYDGIAIDFQSDTFFINVIQPDQKDFQSNFNQVLDATEDQTMQHIACENEIVAAKFSFDNTWYRGQIIKVLDDSMFMVFFIDYGNSECLPADHLRPLPKKFASYPKQALPCKLHNVSLKEDGRLQFADLAFNNIYKYKIVCEKKGIYNVIVYNSDGDVLNDLFKEAITNDYASENDSLLSNSPNSPQEFCTSSPLGVPLSSNASSLSLESSTSRPGAAQMSSIQSELIPKVCLSNDSSRQNLSAPSLKSRVGSDFASQKMKYYTKNMSCLLLDINNCYKLHCTSSDNVNSFYCQLLDDTAILRYFELMKELAKVCTESSANPNFFPEKGELLAAKFLDNDWYRAKALDFRKDEVKVFFVDYGNVSWIDRQNLREISSEIFMEFPILAVRCSLTGISKQKRINETDKFQEKTLNVKVVNKVGSTYEIILAEDLEEDVEKVNFSPSPSKSADDAEKEMLQRQIEELQRKLASYK